MRYSYFIYLLLVSYCINMQAVLVTHTLFTDNAGREIHLFGDNHDQSADHLKQCDKDQFCTFQEFTRKAALNACTTHIYCEVPCSVYYLVNKNLKVTASLVPFVKNIPMPGNVVVQDIEMRGPAVAADFLLTQTVLLKSKLESLPFTTNGTAISLATLIFDDIFNHADVLERQVKLKHKAVFGSQHADIVITDCAISQENRQKLQQQLQALGLESTSLILETSRLLFDHNKLEQRQELLQTIHNTIDPLFRLALMHKIYTAPAHKIIVCAGYNHASMLAQYFTWLGFTQQAHTGENTEVPLECAQYIFNVQAHNKPTPSSKQCCIL